MSQSIAAPLWLRLAAMLYDLLVLLALWMLIGALVLLGFDGDVDVVHQPPLYHVVLQAALLGVTTLYFVVSWCRGGQTIGMRAWRVRVVDSQSRQSPAWSRCVLRFAVAWLSLLAAGAGFIWCLVDHERRAWHDLAARTRLERVPKR